MSMLRLVLMLCLLLAGPLARAASADCSVHWRVTPHLEAQPPRLDITLQFNAGNRQRSQLRLPAGWSLLQAADETMPRLLPVAGDSRLRELRHSPGERLRLSWTLSPAASATAGSGSDQGSGVRLAPRWFAWLGDAVLPWPEEALAAPPNQANPAGPAPSLCLDLDAVPEAPLLLSSHGQGRSGTLRLNLPAQADAVQHALYAGGALDWRELDAQGQRLWVAQPAPSLSATATATAEDIDALATRSARIIGAQRRAWRDDDAAPLLLLLLPAVEGSAASGGLALHRAIALQAAAGAAVPLETWLAEQNQRRWMASRFGPLRHIGRDDLALRSWFSEGLADFLAHRLLLREGLWQTADYAQAFNTRLARWAELPEPAADNLRTATGRAGPEALLVLPGLRGEWLGLQWHQALRQAGQPGLEPLMQGLWLPSAQARPEGPLSAPLATHRLVAALRRQLGDAPLQTLTRHVDEGQPLSLLDDSLGPCFRLVPGTHGNPAGNPAGSPPRYQPRDDAGSACQAWLRNEGEAQAAAPAAGGSKAARGKTSRATGKAGKPAPSKSGKTAAKPGKASKPASKSKPVRR